MSILIESFSIIIFVVQQRPDLRSNFLFHLFFFAFTFFCNLIKIKNLPDQRKAGETESLKLGQSPDTQNYHNSVVNLAPYARWCHMIVLSIWVQVFAALKAISYQTNKNVQNLWVFNSYRNP